MTYIARSTEFGQIIKVVFDQGRILIPINGCKLIFDTRMYLGVQQECTRVMTSRPTFQSLLNSDICQFSTVKIFVIG